MRNWPAFTYAMREHPDSTLHMAVASDYLQEHGDVRWEALAWMAETGKVGEGYGYWSGSATGQADFICRGWLHGGFGTMNLYARDRDRRRVTCRLYLLWRYARATPAVRAEWLRSSDWARR